MEFKFPLSTSKSSKNVDGDKLSKFSKIKNTVSDKLSGRKEWMADQTTRLEELRVMVDESGKQLDQVLLNGGNKWHKQLLEKLGDEWTWRREEQQRRLWAGEVHNRYFSLDTGICSQLLAFEEFMEVQLDNAETPQLCQKMIQSNYLGGLAFTYSKLPPQLERIEPVVLEAGTEIQEEQLEFLGWMPLRPRIQSARKQLEVQRQKLFAPELSQRKEYREKYEEQMKELDERVKQVEDEWKKNLERAEAWQGERKPCDLTRERDLFERITALMGSKLFVRLRDPEITLDALLEGSRQFLEQAHQQLIDPFTRLEEN